jgi:hypothetical protein
MVQIRIVNAGLCQKTSCNLLPSTTPHHIMVDSEHILTFERDEKLDTVVITLGVPLGRWESVDIETSSPICKLSVHASLVCVSHRLVSDQELTLECENDGLLCLSFPSSSHVLDKVICNVHEDSEIALSAVEVKRLWVQAKHRGVLRNVRVQDTAVLAVQDDSSIIQLSLHKEATYVSDISDTSRVCLSELMGSAIVSTMLGAGQTGFCSLQSLQRRSHTHRRERVITRRSRASPYSDGKHNRRQKVRIPVRNPAGIKRDGRGLSERDQCVVCHDLAKCVMSGDCHHMSVCLQCVQQLRAPGTTCPLCRHAVTNWQVVVT